MISTSSQEPKVLLTGKSKYPSPFKRQSRLWEKSFNEWIHHHHPRRTRETLSLLEVIFSLYTKTSQNITFFIFADSLRFCDDHRALVVSLDCDLVKIPKRADFLQSDELVDQLVLRFSLFDDFSGSVNHLVDDSIFLKTFNFVLKILRNFFRGQGRDQILKKTSCKHFRSSMKSCLI